MCQIWNNGYVKKYFVYDVADYPVGDRVSSMIKWWIEDQPQDTKNIIKIRIYDKDMVLNLKSLMPTVLGCMYHINFRMNVIHNTSQHNH